MKDMAKTDRGDSSDSQMPECLSNALPKKARACQA